MKTLYAAACLAATPWAWAQTAPPDADRPRHDGGLVTITGERTGTLPTQLPTTVESIDREQIERSINAVDAEDALKYLPSLLVRKRYAGDYDHAVLSTRASGTGNSARSLVLADGILLSNLLGNGASFTPRWGMVWPEEIERVDVLYGPFSAAYPGNSVGAVVDYVTRMPERFEAHARLSGFGQHFRLYDTDDRYGGGQASVSLGDRSGDWSWRFGVSRLESDSQPLVFATKTPTAASAVPGGTPVTGAIGELNRFNQPWYLVGTSAQVHTEQDQAKFKLAWRFMPNWQATYTGGLWRNDSTRRYASYLRDADGAPVYGGSVQIDGNRFALLPGDFPQTRENLAHQMHGLTLRSRSGGTWDWQASASGYRYVEDRVRTPTTAPPAADVGGPGRLTDLAGTGWLSVAGKGLWRPSGADGAHTVEFGVQQDRFRLRSRVFDLSDWRAAADPVESQRFEGETQLRSLWAQDAWRLSPAWKTVLGGRFEHWQADDGLTAAGAQRFEHPSREASALSPKAALGWQASDDWAWKLSLGRAVRFPTVSELYQGGFDANGVFQNADAQLKPERSWTGELSAEWSRDLARWRATLFHEDTRDALYAQTNTTVTPNVSNIQNVDHIRTTGLELAVSAEDALTKGLDLQASLTYADSVIVANANFPASVGHWQPRVPRWRANVLATWRADEHWSTTAGLRYGGRQYNTLDGSDPNGARYQGVSRFLVADLRVVYRIDKQWRVAGGIDNLGNQTYWNFHPYPQRTWQAELAYDL